jgi:8-oxo-dGTP diphosphatase
MTMSQKDYVYCPFCGSLLEPRQLQKQVRPGCLRCGFIHFLNPKVAVIALIEHAGRVLLVRRAINPGKGLWALPGGFMDAGELPSHALKREIREEVGLEIQVNELLAIFPMVNQNDTSQGIVLAYRATPIDDQRTALQPEDDVDEAAWFAPSEAPAALAFASTRELLDQLKHAGESQPKPA